MTHRPRAVLDADVIYSRVLYELIGRVALRLRVVDLVWSEELLSEAKRSLIEGKRVSEDVAQRWVDHLPRSFPEGRTPIEVTLATLDVAALTTDPGDHHVCALAVAAKADYLITHDSGYVHEGLARHGVEVLKPDAFLCPILDAEPETMLDILDMQAGVWGGGRPVAELVEAIDRAGAVMFVAKAREAMNA